jgi:hypothetical protein
MFRGAYGVMVNTGACGALDQGSIPCRHPMNMVRLEQGENFTNEFDPASAMKYAREGRIEKWVHAFLQSEGNNPGLSDGLKKEKRWWYGPVEMPLETLQRTAGPEPEMEYRSASEEAWAERIGKIQSHLDNKGEVPPLIAQYKDGTLELRDGNHRYGAMVKNGIRSYWTIVWFNSAEEQRDFLKSSVASL